MVQGVVAAAGAAGAAGAGGQGAQAQNEGEEGERQPNFERPQGLQVGQDGWINYQDNDFMVMYDIHRAQIENFDTENDAAAENEGEEGHGDNGAAQGNNAPAQGNNGGAHHDNSQRHAITPNQGNHGYNQGDYGYNQEDPFGQQNNSGAHHGNGPSNNGNVNQSNYGYNQQRGEIGMGSAYQQRPQRSGGLFPTSRAASRNQHRRGHTMTGQPQPLYRPQNPHRPTFGQQRPELRPGESRAGPSNHGHGFGGATQQQQARGNNQQVESHGSGFTPVRRSRSQQRPLEPRPRAPAPQFGGNQMQGPQLPARDGAPQAGPNQMYRPIQPAPPRQTQQGTPRGPTMQQPRVSYPVAPAPQGPHGPGQFQSPEFHQQHGTPQQNAQTMQQALHTGFATPARPLQAQQPNFSNQAQQVVPPGYGTDVRPAPHMRRQAPRQTTQLPQRPHAAQMEPSTPIGTPTGQNQHSSQAEAVLDPWGLPISAPTGDRAMRPGGNQQAAGTPRFGSSPQVMGFPPQVARNAPAQQVVTPQPAQPLATPQPAQVQPVQQQPTHQQPAQQRPANGQSFASAGPAP